MTEISALLLVLIWVICGIASVFMAEHRGESGCLWFLVGCLLGPMGLAVTLFLGGKRCPHCRRTVAVKASKCPYCQSDLPPGP